MSLTITELVVGGVTGAVCISFLGGSLITLVSPTPVDDIGEKMEEWSVTAPSSSIPETAGYIDYYDYLRDETDKIPYALQDALPAFKRTGTTWIKVTGSSMDASFVICTHKGDNSNPAGNEIISYDSTTGEEVINEAEICGSNEEVIS